MKVDAELEAAVAKHGKTTLPKAYNEEFQERINAAKARVAASQA